MWLGHALMRFSTSVVAPHLCLHSATKEKRFGKLCVSIIIALRKFVRCVTTRKPRKPCARNYTRLSAFHTWLRGHILSPLSPLCRGHGSHQIRTLVMKIERFAGHHEAREALLLAVAGVTAIMLATNLILMILY